ncbi:hypothetical protein OROMI_007752 [Orobanche minor]
METKCNQKVNLGFSYISWFEPEVSFCSLDLGENFEYGTTCISPKV